MLRNLFLGLLLANLLVAGWQLWIVPDEVAATVLEAGGKEAELVLASPGASASADNQPARVAEAPSRAQDAPGGRCFRIGPLADAGAADGVRRRLQREGITVSQNSAEGQIWVGHWVQIPNVGTRQQAEAMVSRLNAGGLPDAYILDSAGSVSISLGVFRDRERADKRVADAQRLGLGASVSDRYRPGVQYWLLATVPANRPAALPDVAGDSGQILRSEPVPCAPAGIGGATAIN